MKSRKFLLIVICILIRFYCAAGMARDPALKGISGNIVKISEASRIITQRTVDGKTISLSVPKECLIIKNMHRCALSDLDSGEDILVTTTDGTDETLTARNIFSLDSILMMASGNVSIYEYYGRISDLRLKEKSITVKTESGGLKDFVIADYTIMQKNLKKTELKNFKKGDMVVCEARFRGLPKHSSFNVAALYLFDPISYICNKIGSTQGKHFIQGTIKDFNEKSGVLLLDSATLTLKKDSLWIWQNDINKNNVKGKRVVAFSKLPGKKDLKQEVSTIIDLSITGEIISSINSYKEILRQGITPPIAVGKVVDVSYNRNQMIIKNKWSIESYVRTSPGNTVYTSNNNSKEISFESIKKGDMVFIEGYPPDQAIRVIKM